MIGYDRMVADVNTMRILPVECDVQSYALFSRKSFLMTIFVISGMHYLTQYSRSFSRQCFKCLLDYRGSVRK